MLGPAHPRQWPILCKPRAMTRALTENWGSANAVFFMSHLEQATVLDETFALWEPRRKVPAVTYLGGRRWSHLCPPSPTNTPTPTMLYNPRLQEGAPGFPSLHCSPVRGRSPDLPSLSACPSHEERPPAPWRERRGQSCAGECGEGRRERSLCRGGV